MWLPQYRGAFTAQGYNLTDAPTMSGPDAVFLLLDDPDHTGHSYGYSADAAGNRAAIEAADTQLGMMLTAIKARPNFTQENWQVILTTAGSTQVTVVTATRSIGSCFSSSARKSPRAPCSPMTLPPRQGPGTLTASPRSWSTLGCLSRQRWKASPGEGEGDRVSHACLHRFTTVRVVGASPLASGWQTAGSPERAAWRGDGSPRRRTGYRKATGSR
jgi:hypothetical protein